MLLHAAMEDYCKAISEVRLPAKPSGSGSKKSCFYDEERFQEFVKSDIDLRDMSHHMADFTQSSGVAQALRTIRSGLQSGLLQRLGCIGSLFEIGSFYDGSKTGRLNEMDCLYVVSESDIVIQQASSGKGDVKVYLKGTEIKPRDINEKLIAAMKETLSEMTLPDGWTHGGYGSPDFSGPRCNGPSVTAMFCNKDEKHVSLDVSIAFPLTSQLQKRADFPSHLRDSCQFLEDSISQIQQELPRTQISADLHLIGNLVDDTWQQTTALAEAEILRVLSPKCSVKRALEICKVIASEIQRWCNKHSTWNERSSKAYDDGEPAERIQLSLSSAERARESIVAELKSYSERTSCSKAESRDRLNTALAYRHIYLSSENRNDFKEVLKSDASINNAAIKHIILKTALELKGGFSETSKQCEKQLIRALIRAVFEKLSSTDSFDTEHALVPNCMISKFSFSVYLSHIKESIANDLSQQCGIVLDNAFAQDFQEGKGFPQIHQHEHLAEYCYKIDAEVTPSGKLTKARTGEQIAMVLSALINSGGGVMIIHLVTPEGTNTELDACEEDIARLITQQELWLSEDVFKDTICITKNEAEKEIYFFTNNTKHLVTHNYNAYDLKQSHPQAIVSNTELMRIIRTCTCTNEGICEKHKALATKSQILSRLPNTDRLIANQSFPAPKSDSCQTHFYRNYQLNDRSLADVLNTQSVQCEMLELVSALANREGGSIFLGVTNTATPKVRGYRLTEKQYKCTEQCISDILTGTKHGPVTVWGQPQIESTHYWKTFIHDVVSDERKVIEICVKKCPGGMFCALPVLLDIKDTGEIYQVDSFAEWEKRVLQGTSDSFYDDQTDPYCTHLKSKEMVDKNASPDANMEPTAMSSMTQEPPEQTASSPEFHWWLSNDGVVAQSLRFDQCCSKELADRDLDISTTFSTFPPTEAIIERFASIECLQDTLKEILQEHKGDTGVAVFMENVSDTGIWKDVTNEYHVFDLVILKTNQPPVLITIFKDESSREAAKKYCLKVGQLLKRTCCTYMGKDKGSMKFFFKCQLYFLGHGHANLQQEVWYPEAYLQPSTETLNAVRYALARILLDCQHITDRYGNIMVRHLPSYQAKVLLERRPKVLIVKSIAGSGKTVLALEMARRLKKQHGKNKKIVFLCRSKGLAAFVKSQTKGSEVFDSVEECNSERTAELRTSFFSQYTDIIIDDAHAIPVSGEPKGWTMYNALFASLKKRSGHACIFLDPDMQDYRGCTPGDFVTQLEALAVRYVGNYHVKIEPLGKILRNSRRICQFTKACLGTGNYVDELTTVRQIPEDGVFYHNIQDREASSEETKTLLSRLSELEQYRKQDITILTESQEDKAWVTEMLKGKYQTQDATQFPVEHVVIDTLANFEGLESPVILFMIPKSWSNGYVGSLKYRLCVVTRAISRLEFLLPWDASQRQQDLAELNKAFALSPPVDYGSLKVTQEHRTQAGDRVMGMCYYSGRLYTVEEWTKDWSRTLAVYNVTDHGTVTLLDTLNVQGYAEMPRVDHQTGRVYIPCGFRGVCVVRYDGSKLVPVTTLRCVRDAGSLAVVSTNTLYVCDWDSETVCLVDVTQDRVTARLQPPREVRGERPSHVAVLGDTVLVMYAGPKLVIYRHGVPTPGKPIRRPQGLKSVYGLTTDQHSSFLVSAGWSHTVSVLDISGKLTHSIPIHGNRMPRDCTVVGGQLQVVCNNGYVIDLSSQ